MSDIKPDKHISSLLVAAATCRIMFPDEGDIGRAVHILANETERLVEDVRWRREEREQIDEAISGAGFEPCDGETTLKRVKRLIATNEKDREAMNELAQSSERERARAEKAEAELAALRAPVDVEAELDAIARDAVQMGAQSEAAVRGAVRDVVDRAARFAKDADYWRDVAAARGVERRATERTEGRPLSEPWNADAVYAVRALLHDDSR